MKRLALFSLLAMLATSDHLSATGRFDQLFAVYYDLDRMCRGWPGNDPHLGEVCVAREKVRQALLDFGYCEMGALNADRRWIKCR